MIFEYKVKVRHRLGWKEFKLYADTDIEEFFNRNSIDYVRNMTDTVEHRLLKEIEILKSRLEEYQEYVEINHKEIERLNNIINEVEKEIKWQRKICLSLNNYGVSVCDILLNKLQELKGSDKE